MPLRPKYLNTLPLGCHLSSGEGNSGILGADTPWGKPCCGIYTASTSLSASGRPSLIWTRIGRPSATSTAGYQRYCGACSSSFGVLATIVVSGESGWKATPLALAIITHTSGLWNNFTCQDCPWATGTSALPGIRRNTPTRFGTTSSFACRQLAWCDARLQSYAAHSMEFELSYYPLRPPGFDSETRHQALPGCGHLLSTMTWPGIPSTARGFFCIRIHIWARFNSQFCSYKCNTTC